MAVIWNWYCIQHHCGVEDPDAHLADNPTHNIMQVLSTTSEPDIQFVLHTDPLPSEPPIGNIDASKIKTKVVDVTDIGDLKVLKYYASSDTIKYGFGGIETITAADEPTLPNNGDLIIWEDTTESKVWLLFKTSSGSQVKVELQ